MPSNYGQDFKQELHRIDLPLTVRGMSAFLTGSILALGGIGYAVQNDLEQTRVEAHTNHDSELAEEQAARLAVSAVGSAVMLASISYDTSRRKPRKERS